LILKSLLQPGHNTVIPAVEAKSQDEERQDAWREAMALGGATGGSRCAGREPTPMFDVLPGAQCVRAHRKKKPTQASSEHDKGG
jgi:hypothetical protein